jgi:ABC-type multidrug transport system fused ATPase/permease subunit
VAGLRQELQRRVVGLPLRQIEEASSGSLASRVIFDSDQARFWVGNGLVQLVASVLTAALASALLFRLNTPLTLTVLAILGLYGIGISGAFRHLSKAFEGVSLRQAELSGWLSQVLGGVRVVKAYAAERREAHRFAHASHQLVRESVAALRVISALGASGPLVSGVLGLLVLVSGSRAVATGTMSLGSLVMFIWLTGLLLAPVMHIAAAAAEVSRSVGALRRIAQLRGFATEEEEDRTGRRMQCVLGEVNFEDVSFAYTAGQLTVRNVSLHAPAGTIVALVGANGAGKSTICRLLLGFDRPTNGRILIDGQDLATVRRRDYRAHVALVSQEDVLFDGDISDNIWYGRPGAGHRDMLAAARLAHCDEFVQTLPNGYGTRVGERGVRLSGGQRQRVAIARAMLADPSILILDEATSSLDSEGELLVQEALRILCAGRTTFVIAHRLATVRSADQILMIDGGVIVERGNHEDLAGRETRYWRLHQAQQRAEQELLSTDSHQASADRKHSYGRVSL